MEEVNLQPSIILPTKREVINQICKDIGEDLIGREDSFIIKYQSDTSSSLYTTIYRKRNDQYIAIQHNIKEIEYLKRSNEKLQQLCDSTEVNLLSVRQELLKLARPKCESYVVRPVNPCTTIRDDVNYIIIDDNLFLSVDEEHVLEGCKDSYDYYCEDNEWKRNLPLPNSLTKENVRDNIINTLKIITDKITRREQEKEQEQVQPKNTKENKKKYMKIGAQIVIGLIPVVGPATNAIWNFSSGNIVLGFVDLGFCALDVATWGSATAIKGILFGSIIVVKGTAKIIGKTTARAVIIRVAEGGIKSSVTYYAQKKNFQQFKYFKLLINHNIELY